MSSSQTNMRTHHEAKKRKKVIIWKHIHGSWHTITQRKVNNQSEWRTEQQRHLIIWWYAQWKGTNQNQTKQVTYVSISFLHIYTSEHCDLFNTNTRTHNIYRPHLMITYQAFRQQAISHAHTTIHLTHTTDLWLGYAWLGKVQMHT